MSLSVSEDTHNRNSCLAREFPSRPIMSAEKTFFFNYLWPMYRELLKAFLILAVVMLALAVFSAPLAPW